jgi:dihydrofolate reductase
MGRKTWESLPAIFRPLQGRENWVLTRDGQWAADGALRASSLESICQLHAGEDLWVAGGGEVYALALPLAQECFVTEIDADFSGDAWAPGLAAAWRPVEDHPATSDWQTSTRAGLMFRYRVFERDTTK